MPDRLHVAHVIGSTGVYGAERWVLALLAQQDSTRVRSTLVNVTEGPTPSAVVEVARQRGVAAVDLETGGRFSPRGAMRLARLARGAGVRVLHTHGYKADALGLLAAPLCGARVVATPHGWSREPDRRLAAYEWLDRRLLRFAWRVCPLSPALADDLRRHGVPAARLRLILNGVDLDEVDDQGPAWPRQPGEVVIGYLGQLIARKDVATLLTAFSEVARHREDARLLIAGDGPLDGALRATAAELGLEHRVRFLGYRRDGIAVLKTLDLLVLPSREEGIPRCVMEAMAAGVPVVASDIPGSHSLIAHRHTGLLAPPGEPSALAAAIAEVLADPAAAKERARHARQRVEEDFSARRMAADYADLYQACASSS